MAWRVSVRLTVAVALLLAAGPGASADELHVNSGEHPGFSRLVVKPSRPAGWQFGRDGGGYALRITDPGISFDTSTIYRKIPRTRLREVAAENGVLRLFLGCDCHATAESTASGQIVIDVADGPPTGNSPFEKPLRADSAGADVHPRPRPRGLVTSGSGPSLAFRPDARAGAAGTVAWRPSIDVPRETGPRTGEATPQAGLSPETAPPPEVATEFEPAGAEIVESGRTYPIAPLEVPAPGMAETETEILRELSRAATQGLIHAPEPSVDMPAPEEPVAAAPDHPPEPKPAPDAHIAFRAETAVDRAEGARADARRISGAAVLCPAEDRLAFVGWGAAGDAARQLSEARQGLVGEFDKPDPEALARVAKLYLYFGLGAEARHTLTAFAVDVPDARPLSDIGRILDDEPISKDGSLDGLAGCGGAVALWAFLAADGSTDRYADFAPIVRAFSALPPHLRDLIGQRLADKLIAAGAADAARAVRNAASREGGAGARQAALMDAKLDLVNGRPHEAARTLDDLAGGGDDLSEEAALLSLRSRVDGGEALSPQDVERIAALAFERRASPDGEMLADLEIRARALSADFEAAFDSYGRWRDFAPDAGRGATAGQLLHKLAERAPEGEFARLYFENRGLLNDAGDNPALRLSLAERLEKLGFAEEVAPVLHGRAAHSEKGRLLLARAALSLGAPGRAVKILSTLQGIEADALRAKARRLTSAADLDLDSSGSSAVLDVAPAGDTGNESSKGPDTEAASIEAGRRLLGESSTLRTALEARLAQDPATAP